MLILAGATLFLSSCFEQKDGNAENAVVAYYEEPMAFEFDVKLNDDQLVGVVRTQDLRAKNHNINVVFDLEVYTGSELLFRSRQWMDDGLRDGYAVVASEIFELSEYGQY